MKVKGEDANERTNYCNRYYFENTLAVNVAVDHIPFIASLVFAENA